MGFTKGFESFFKVEAGGFDGVGGLEVGFDFGIVAGLTVDFVEVNHGSLSHAEFLAAAGDFGNGFEAKLKDNIDEFFVVGDGGLFDDVDTGIFDVASQNEVIIGGLIDRLHFGAHNEFREVGVRLVVTRYIDAVVLPVDR